MRDLSRLLFAVLILVFALSAWAHPAAADPEADKAFRGYPAEKLAPALRERLDADPAIARWRALTLNTNFFKVLDRAQLVLPGLDGKPIVLTRRNAFERRAGQTRSWFGRVEGRPKSSARLVMYKNTIVGQIEERGRTLDIATLRPRFARASPQLFSTSEVDQEKMHLLLLQRPRSTRPAVFDLSDHAHDWAESLVAKPTRHSAARAASPPGRRSRQSSGSRPRASSGSSGRGQGASDSNTDCANGGRYDTSLHGPTGCPVTVNILGVYTAEAKEDLYYLNFQFPLTLDQYEEQHGPADIFIQNQMEYFIELTNDALASSGVGHRVRATHYTQIDREDNLTRKKQQNWLKEQLPDRYSEVYYYRWWSRADVVSFWISTNTGKANRCAAAGTVMQEYSQHYAKKATFVMETAKMGPGKVCDWQERPYRFAHETGHVMGLVHEHEDGRGLYDLSRGYSDDEINRQTIMTYPKKGYCEDTEVFVSHCEQVPRFSGPNVYWDGKRMGVAGKKEAANTLRTSMPMVATFRDYYELPPLEYLDEEEQFVLEDALTTCLIGSQTDEDEVIFQGLCGPLADGDPGVTGILPHCDNPFYWDAPACKSPDEMKELVSTVCNDNKEVWSQFKLDLCGYLFTNRQWWTDGYNGSATYTVTANLLSLSDGTPTPGTPTVNAPRISPAEGFSAKYCHENYEIANLGARPQKEKFYSLCAQNLFKGQEDTHKFGLYSTIVEGYCHEASCAYRDKQVELCTAEMLLSFGKGKGLGFETVATPARTQKVSIDRARLDSQRQRAAARARPEGRRRAKAKGGKPAVAAGHNEIVRGASGSPKSAQWSDTGSPVFEEVSERERLVSQYGGIVGSIEGELTVSPAEMFNALHCGE